MAKKAARRNGGRVSHTVSQKKRRKRLQHFNGQAKLARRVNIEGWSDSLSLTRNYKNLGIAFDANAILSKPNEAFEDPKHQLIPEKTGIMTERLEYLQSLPAPAPYEVKSMNVQEQYQLQRLIQSHADDYEAMQSDLKLNVSQMTANKLQKRIELMFRLQHASNPTPSSTGTTTKQSHNNDDNEDEDYDDEDFEDEDMEDMTMGDDEEEEEEEEDEEIDAEQVVPKVNTDGLDEYETVRATRARQRMVNKINNINHNKLVNKQFKSGLAGAKYGSKIVVPALSQLVSTRTGTRKTKE